MCTVSQSPFSGRSDSDAMAIAGFQGQVLSQSPFSGRSDSDSHRVHGLQPVRSGHKALLAGGLIQTLHRSRVGAAAVGVTKPF